MTTILFLITVLLSLSALYFGTGKDRRIVGLLTVWQLVVSYIGYSGLFQQHPFLLPITILFAWVIVIWSVRIPHFKKLNFKYLLGIHVLRIPVEIVLYQLFLEQKIPRLMTFVGWNWDILPGLIACLFLVYMIIRKRSVNPILLTLWNIYGTFSLLLIFSLALLSSPLPIQQLAFTQPNIAVLEFPFCLLPTCIVPIVFLSHWLLITKSNSLNLLTRHCTSPR